MVGSRPGDPQVVAAVPMDQWPKISVIIVTRNRVKTLQRTLDRLFEDDYPNREIVVCDGNSTDGTVQLLQKYNDKLGKWRSEPDTGEYDGANKGVALATGDIIKFLPDDDELRPGALRQAALWMAEHPDVELAFGQTAVWDDATTPPKFVHETNWELAQFGAKDWFRHQSKVLSVAAFIRRSVFERIGPFDLRFKCGDTEYWIRAAQAGLRFGAMPYTVMDYHLTGDNGITKYSQRIARELIQIAWEKGTLDDINFMLTWMGPRALGLEPQAQAVFRWAEQYNVHPFRMIRSLRGRVRR